MVVLVLASEQVPMLMPMPTHMLVSTLGEILVETLVEALEDSLMERLERLVVCSVTKSRMVSFDN